MKRVFVVFAFVCLAAGLLSSCKSHERCPAYGKVDKVEQKAERV